MRHAHFTPQIEETFVTLEILLSYPPTILHWEWQISHESHFSRLPWNKYNSTTGFRRASCASIPSLQCECPLLFRTTLEKLPCPIRLDAKYKSNEIKFLMSAATSSLREYTGSKIFDLRILDNQASDCSFVLCVVSWSTEILIESNFRLGI